MNRQVGSVTLIVSALLVTGVVLTLLVVDVARVTAVRAQLSTAADAAALAAAPETFASFGNDGDPWNAAAATAAANGATLIACRCAVDRSWSSRTAVVVVEKNVELVLVDSRRIAASSAAEFRPIEMVQSAD